MAGTLQYMLLHTYIIGSDISHNYVLFSTIWSLILYSDVLFVLLINTQNNVDSVKKGF